MIPTYGKGSGVPNGMPPIDNAAIPAIDMSSYTVYEWMESDLGLGLKPLEAKVYAMIYQASMHHRGYFQINQTEFCKEVGVARQTLNRILKGFVESGLVLTLEATVKGHRGVGALETSAVYLAAQGPINAAVISVMDDKRLRAAREWSTRAVGVPMPEYLTPFSQTHYQVINNPQVVPLSQNVTADVTCGNVTLKNPSAAIVDNSAVTKCDSGTTCGNVEKALVAPLSQNVTADVTCGNAERPQDSPLSQKMTAVVTKCDSGATCGNIESDKCLLEPSTCGSIDKTAGREFDRSTYIDERRRMKEDIQVRESLNNDTLGSKPFLSVGRDDGGRGSWRPLTPSEHTSLSTFLSHWPKSVGSEEAYEDTTRAYSHCLDSGYTAEQIQMAAAEYLGDFLSTHDIKADPSQRRFIMFPLSFLTRPDGLAKWALLAREPEHAGNDEPPIEEEVSVKRFGSDSDGIWAYRDEYGNWSPLPSSRNVDESEAVRLARRQKELLGSYAKGSHREGVA